MEKFDKILVALDRSQLDASLLRYARKLAGWLQAEKVYLVHIIPNLNLPKNAEHEFKKLFAPEMPLDERVEAEIESMANPLFDDLPGTEVAVEVIEGKPYQKLMHWLEVKGIDLLVVGKKQESKGSGITSRRLANRANCSVLFVPEGVSLSPNELIVPIDFSEDSALALKGALDLKPYIKDSHIKAVHITDQLAAGYYLNQKEYASFNRFLAEAAQESFDEFIQRNQFNEHLFERVTISNEAGSIADQISKFAEENAPSLVLIGAQGRSAVERFFFGSVTEKVVTQGDLKHPVLVVRP
jgi:nucleotide-binding universal stress UspA family protein